MITFIAVIIVSGANAANDPSPTHINASKILALHDMNARSCRVNMEGDNNIVVSGTCDEIIKMIKAQK